MESIKEIFKICNQAYWYDYSNIYDLKKLHKFLIKNFDNNIPAERLLISLSTIDDISLKIYNNETDDIIEYIHKLKEQILYMLSFQKTVEDEQEIN